MLNMASYFNRNDVQLNGTFWVRRTEGESARYRQPWLRFTHTFTTTEYEQLHDWLLLVAAGTDTAPLFLNGMVRQLHQIPAADPGDISLDLWYEQSPEPVWWAWDITAPLHIRLEIPRDEFRHLITVFEKIEWSYY